MTPVPMLVSVSLPTCKTRWCKVFDDMMESPYIDMDSIREVDRIAILSWLSSNYKSPVKRDKPNY